MHGLLKCGVCGWRTVRPSDGKCLREFAHWKSRGAPEVRQGMTRATAGSTKRCPMCREAQRGRGCFISACPCDCHRTQAMLNAGVPIQQVPKVRAPLAKRTFGSGGFSPRLADHGHSHD